MAKRDYEVAGLSRLDATTAARVLSKLAERSIKHIWEADDPLVIKQLGQHSADRMRTRNQKRLEYALREMNKRKLPLSFVGDLIRKVPKVDRHPRVRERND